MYLNMRYNLRRKLLRPDDGAGASGAAGGGTGNPTANPANPTGGGQDPNTQAGGAGAGTDPATNQAQDPSKPATQPNPANPNPEQKPAKFTDDDMAAARGRWEAEAKQQADKAARDAKDLEAIDQGKAKEVAAERLTSIHSLEARISKMEPVLQTRLDELTKDWPKSILDRQPKKEDGYEARVDWYEAYKDVVADFVAQRPNDQPQNYGGNGYQPRPAGGGGNQTPAQQYIGNTYAPPKKQ